MPTNNGHEGTANSRMIEITHRIDRWILGSLVILAGREISTA
jgi:hypothetical protein